MFGTSTNQIRTVDPIALGHLTLHVLQQTEQCLGMGQCGKLSQYKLISGFPGGSAVKNSSANARAAGGAVQSLGQEDPLEEEMATHSSILA